MPRTETFSCEVCDDAIDNPKRELVVITVTRPNEETVTSYIHNECLEENLDGNEFLEAVVLHD